ncbi:MAG: hypothetical protein JJT94_06050 [Bernardetiaceae bacterium]|nr:hypothetical protein [Bernardetiaceae bacterium]
MMIWFVFACNVYHPRNLFTGYAWFLGYNDQMEQDLSKKEKLRAIVNMDTEGLITVKCASADKNCYEYEESTHRLVVYQDVAETKRIVFFWVAKVGVSYSLEEEVGEVRIIAFEILSMPGSYYDKD